MAVTAPVIEFVTAVPGFPEARSWSLRPWGDDEDSPFRVMASLDVEGLQFVVVPPVLFFPEYAPEIDDATAEALGVTAAEQVAVYVVLTLGDTLEDTTANLLGPVVINMADGRAAQAVLHQPGLSTKTPLLAG
jgi:flagellar assembly factor FliW